MEPQVTEDTNQSELSLGPTGYEAGRVWTVIATGKQEAMQANGVGGIGHIFVDRNGQIPNQLCIGRKVTVRELKPSRPNANGLYEVKVDYGAPSAAGGSQPQPGGPPKASWSGFLHHDRMDMAWDTEGADSQRTVPIVDRNGNPFDPPPQDDYPMLSLTVEWVTQSFSPLQYYLLQGSVNVGGFFGIPRAFGKLVGIGSSVRDDNMITASLTVHVNPETWYLVLLDLIATDPNDGPAAQRFNPRFRDWGQIPIPSGVLGL